MPVSAQFPSNAQAFNRTNYAQRRPNLIKRGQILAALRQWFNQSGFIEVETPILQLSPGLEPHLAAFETQVSAPDGQNQPIYLHTSPEFAMKKLLAAGEHKIFQFARVFRNGERASTHHPEFTMLEWYRADAPYTQLMDDCEALVRCALGSIGAETLRFRGKRCDGRLPFERLSVPDAFQRHAGITLPLLSYRDGFAASARNIGIRIAPDDDWDTIFFKIFLERIEPFLGIGAPTILYDYPIHMAALSRPKPDDPHVAERFELYICGLEMANAFGELTDAGEQRRRFEHDMAVKQALYGVTYPIDADFLTAVGQLPPCSGIALGFDRLVMALCGVDHIEDVLWLPVQNLFEA
jgi:lysyl-tRNA synthetase class 2